MSENFSGNNNSSEKDKTEDKIVFHKAIKDMNALGRKINPVPLERTSGNDEIRIPEVSPKTENTDSAAARFIKTGTTPFISAAAPVEPENDGKHVEKFSDRFSVKAVENKTYAVNTADSNSYSRTHSLFGNTGRMIIPAEKIAENSEKADAEKNTAAAENGNTGIVETKQVSFDEEGNADIENIYENAPTKHMNNPKGALLREIAGTAEDGVRRNPDQLMMDGFDSVGNENNSEKADEEAHLNTELRKTRQKRISDYKFWGKKADSESGSTDEKFTKNVAQQKELPQFLQKIADRFSGLNTDFTPVNSEEFTDFNDRKEVFSKLINVRKNVLLRMIIMAVAGVVLFGIDLGASISAAADTNGFFSIFGGSYTVYVSVNMFVLVAGAVIMFRDIKTGLFSLLKLQPKTDTSLLILFTAAFLQNICAYFTQLKLEENLHLLTPAVMLLCIPYLLSKLFYYDNMRQCFKSVAVKSEKSYLRCVNDGELSAELLRDRNGSEQSIVYPGKTRFVENFISRAAGSASDSMPASRCVLITAGISLITGIIVALVRKNGLYGLTAAELCLAVSFPVSCLVVTAAKISHENGRLSVKSSFVQSYSDAEDFALIDNLVVKDSDIFTADVTNCLCAKNVSEKQAQFCAAVLTSHFGGPLYSALLQKVSGLEEKFPEAENLVCEEKLGLSAWISGCKVLLGTQNLLINHNVEIPDEKVVSAFFTEGEIPVYLALEGNFAAVLGVKYSYKPEVAEGLSTLVENGTTLLLCTSDAVLSEKFAEKILGLPDCSLRTVSFSSSKKLCDSANRVTDYESTGIVFNEAFDGLCKCASVSVGLDRTKRILGLVCEAGAYVGLLIAVILGFTGAFSGVNALLPVLFQFLWIAISIAATGAVCSSVGGVKKSLSEIQLHENIFVKNPDENSATEEAGTVDDVEEEAAAGEEKTVEEPEEEPAEKFVPQGPLGESGVITAETIAALDSLAGMDGTEGHVGLQPVGGNYGTSDKREASNTHPIREAENSVYTDVISDDGEDEKYAASNNGLLKKAKSVFGGILSRFTVVNYDEDDDDETDDRFYKKPSSGSLPNEADKKYFDETARISASFTPPEIPEAPHFELGNARKENASTPSASARSIYGDEVFSRFEDDKIFAALHEK